MAHTNHRRLGDKPRDDGTRYTGSPMGSTGDKGLLSDVKVGANWGGDNSNGHRGIAEAKAGGKKFVRSRIRFHENAATRRLAKDSQED